jgi:uncharacterized membrane protein
MTKHRLELFTDGVFAIVLTLLVLDLKVPGARGWAGGVEIAPALLVHAATFTIVGAFWYIHHGAFARVTEISPRTVLFNLVLLFWITLLPFCAKTIAAFPGDPLGASMIAGDCALCQLAMIVTRLSAHSTIDDNAAMRAWRRGRLAMVWGFTLADILGAGLAWVSPWYGYGAALATVLLFLLLRAPSVVEQKFGQSAG